MKRLLLILLAIGMVVLTGCVNKTGTKEKITLRVTSLPDIPVSGQEEGFLTQILKAFEAESGIDVKLEGVPGDLLSKVLTQIAGGAAPDVFFIMDKWLPTLVEKGTIVSIDSLIETGMIEIEDYFPQAYEAYTYKNKIYAIAESCSPYVIYYNKSIFDNEGIKYPDGTWTWLTFLEAGQKLMKEDKRGAVSQHGAFLQYLWEIFLKQNGASFFNRNGTECIVDSPEAQEGIRFICELSTKYHVVPTSSDLQNFGGIEMFMLQKAAMFHGGRWYSDTFRTKKGLYFGIAPLPKGRSRATLFMSHAFAVPAQSRHQKEALELIAFIAGEKSQRIMHFEAGDAVPTLKHLATSKEFLYMPQFPEERDNHIYIDSLSYSFIAQKSPYIPPLQMEDIMSQEMDKTLLGLQTVSESLKKIEKMANSIIQDRK